MPDPLSDLIALLRPRTVFAKGISGAGPWAVRYGDFGHPGFCTVIEGRCRLAVDGAEAMTIEAGDFVFLPATPGFTMSGFEPAEPEPVAEKDILLVETLGRDILTERARRIEQRGVDQILAPPVIMIGGIMMDRLVDAAMDGPVGLLVAREAHRTDGDYIRHRQLADGAGFVAPKGL